MGTVLTITHSDTSGRSGIQPDLETIASLECHATSAITAITSRSTNGQAILYPIPHEHIATQITSILAQFIPKAVKVGALYDIDSVQAVVKALTPEGTSSSPTIVCDPVCVSVSGRTLIDPGVTETIIESLFPLSNIITPDKSQAERLLSHKGSPTSISTLGDMVSAAKNLLQYRPSAVLLKGGNTAFDASDIATLSQEYPDIELIPVNLPSDNMEILRVHSGTPATAGRAVNVLCDAKQTALFVMPYVEGRNEDQMGSTLSAALTSQLACGFSLKDAVKHAVMYTHLAAASTDDAEHGRGIINHFHASVQRVIPQVTASNRYPFTQRLIEGDAAQWKAYVEHDFVKQVGRGTLDRKAFEHFIKQDYKYLTYYSRAQALLAAKSTSFQTIRDAIQPIMNVLQEIETHKEFARTYGITEADLENEPEAVSTTAYGAYLIDIGTQGDTTKLLMALLACLVGYGEVGLWLKKEASLPNSWVVTDQNPYKRWMDDMAGEMYQTAVKVGLEIIESRAVADPPSPARYAEWEKVWRDCTKFEKGFWDAAIAAVAARE